MSWLEVNGVRVYPGYLGHTDQEALVEQVRAVVAAAPMINPETPMGRRMSVRMTAAGEYGWISDSGGYRYERQHPSGVPWPPIPPLALQVWEELSGVHRAPQCCLVNYYDATARMGMHQDKDEANFDMPVVSISLGDEALFRVGGTSRGGPTKSVWLRSGDVALLTGPSRLAYHGIDRVRPDSSTLLPNGGRINLTMRVVD